MQGQVVLITGASRGIGLAIASRVIAEGGRVCITARNAVDLADAVENLGGPSRAIGVPGKADDPEHQANAVRVCVEAFGRLDVLVNNTGINPAYGPVLDLERAAAQKILGVNFIAALEWTGAVSRTAFQSGGTVINLASVAGLATAAGIGVYGSSKAALIHMTRQLAMELAPHIRVNAVAPAVVRTQFATRLFQNDEAAVATRYPLKRLGEPADVAAAVAFLACDDASWITGQTIIVDGGLTLTGRL